MIDPEDRIGIELHHVTARRDAAEVVFPLDVRIDVIAGVEIQARTGQTEQKPRALARRPLRDGRHPGTQSPAAEHEVVERPHLAVGEDADHHHEQEIANETRDDHQLSSPGSSLLQTKT